MISLTSTINLEQPRAGGMLTLTSAAHFQNRSHPEGFG